MGCGKSTAAKLFEAHGFNRIDIDQIVRERILTDSSVIRNIQKRHPSVITPAGAIDRPILAQIIFSDENERIWLEALIHPLTHKAWHAIIKASPQKDWIVEVPLLFEKNLEKEFDFTLCVSSNPDTQVARLEKRGVSRVLAKQRLSKQLPLDIKIKRSDIVICNDGTLESLEEQILYIIHTLNSAFKSEYGRR